jgi:hypothetical protein
MADRSKYQRAMRPPDGDADRAVSRAYQPVRRRDADSACHIRIMS